MAIVGVIKDIIVGLAAIFAAYIAYKGLSTWREELKGKSEYQLAKDVLMSVYRVREAFKYVRNPMMTLNEYPEKFRTKSMPLNEDDDYEAMKYAYNKRLEKLYETFNELEEKHLEAQVEWGSSCQNKIVPLRKRKAKLISAIWSMLGNKKNPKTFKQSEEEFRKERSVLYYVEGSEHDNFTPQINEAIKEFEDWLRPHVSRKY